MQNSTKLVEFEKCSKVLLWSLANMESPIGVAETALASDEAKVATDIAKQNASQKNAGLFRSFMKQLVL